MLHPAGTRPPTPPPDQLIGLPDPACHVITHVWRHKRMPPLPISEITPTLAPQRGKLVAEALVLVDTSLTLCQFRHLRLGHTSQPIPSEACDTYPSHSLGRGTQRGRLGRATRAAAARARARDTHTHTLGSTSATSAAPAATRQSRRCSAATRQSRRCSAATRQSRRCSAAIRQSRRCSAATRQSRRCSAAIRQSRRCSRRWAPG